MTELTATSLLSLALAAAIGALVAWLLRGLLLGDASRTAELALREQLAHRETELLGLRTRYRDLETRAASLDSERQDANREIVILAKSLETDRAALVTARAAADAWQSRHATVAAELGSTAAALASLRAEHATLGLSHERLGAMHTERGDQIAALERELAALRSQMDATVGAPADGATELMQLKNELATSKRHLHEKASALTTAEGRIVDAYRELDRLRAVIRERTGERDACTAACEEAKARVSALTDELAAVRASQATPVADVGAVRSGLLELEQFSQEDLRDNLEDIHGVGPKLAELLYSLGVNTFRQVASWTEAEIDAMDVKLEDFHGRIRRENWVASAREEYEKKYQRPFVPLRRA